jgi:hypothetical protein
MRVKQSEGLTYIRNDHLKNTNKLYGIIRFDNERKNIFSAISQMFLLTFYFSLKYMWGRQEYGAL